MVAGARRWAHRPAQIANRKTGRAGAPRRRPRISTATIVPAVAARRHRVIDLALPIVWRGRRLTRNRRDAGAALLKLMGCGRRQRVTKTVLRTAVGGESDDEEGDAVADMLVRLYDLPDAVASRDKLRQAGVDLRRALPPEKHTVVGWVRSNFSAGWANECEVAFSRQPVACFIATTGQDLVGFVCHDVTCKNFFGPLGVGVRSRRQGIGAALSLTCLTAMAHAGYAYAIVGSAGPMDFFTKLVGATVIEKSHPGIYRGLLRSG